VAKSSKKKASKASGGGFQLFDDAEAGEVAEDEELPKDEIGRQKIKTQYVDLLGIRIEKLRGRILNRERINKTLEGIYFICSRCGGVCHNLDEGLVEDEGNEDNMCKPCSEAPAQPTRSAEATAARIAAVSKRAAANRKAKRAKRVAARIAKAEPVAPAKPLAKAAKSSKAAKTAKPTKAAKAAAAAKASRTAKVAKAAKSVKKKAAAKKARASKKK
jgi:hypothetical protein